MLVWFPEKIRYDRSLGTAEIVCPGCRERVVAEVHEKLKASDRVGRCRLCESVSNADATGRRVGQFNQSANPDQACAVNRQKT